MAATQTSSSAMVRGHVRRLAPSSSSCLAHPPGFGERSPSTKGGARRGRGVVTRAAAANDAAASGGGFGGGFGSTSLGTLGSAIELRSRLQDLDVERNRSRGGRDGDGWEEINGAWCRTPPGRAWGVAHFIGGAVLGSYPHIAYDAFLSQLCDEAGVFVVATPYELGTNHSAISAECQAKLNSAWGAVAAREGYNPGAMPVFAVGHSLGCKLQLIAACGGGAAAADGDDAAKGSDKAGAQAKTGGGEGASANGGDAVEEPAPPSNRAGHLFLAFNNATAADSVRLLEKFAREILKKRAETAAGGDRAANDAFDGFMRNLPSLTALAERAATAAGLAFTPSPEETLEDARRQFASPKVRFVSFGDDDLDQNDELAAALRRRYEVTLQGPAPVSIAKMPGTHLTPVFFKFDGAKVSPAFAQMGGLSVGDEEAVKKLAEESVRFLKGTA